MNAEDIAVQLANHEQRLVGAEHRIKDVEETHKQIHELSISVNKLAISVNNMVEEQKSQAKRIAVMEAEPAERYKAARRTLITSIISALGGAIGGGLITLIANGL